MRNSIALWLVFMAMTGQQKTDTIWSDLRNAGNRTVTVQTSDGDHVQGRILRVDDSAIVVGDPPFTQVIPKTDVCRIYVGVARRAGRIILITGLATAGYFLGQLLGNAVTDDPNNKGGIAGAGVGALAGSAIPIHERVLYAGLGCYAIP
jgi:hypothetical protein